ncbi:MAG: hypothetical protein LBP59_10755 [Planctomycetaceae bacterium]|jgi:hypothetical protein|nr:hypothetical protein [Planctomycetaceae bacterium]
MTQERIKECDVFNLIDRLFADLKQAMEQVKLVTRSNTDRCECACELNNNLLTKLKNEFKIRKSGTNPYMNFATVDAVTGFCIDLTNRLETVVDQLKHFSEDNLCDANVYEDYKKLWRSRHDEAIELHIACTL